jgi:density-regulated protein
VNQIVRTVLSFHDMPGLIVFTRSIVFTLFAFLTLCSQYGPEPDDPFYEDSDEDDDDDDDNDDEDDDNGEQDMANLTLSAADKKKRRGAQAKQKKNAEGPRVVVQKRAQNKKRILTVIVGMETVPDIKLKDVSKAFSRKFAGSSSVKDAAIPTGKEGGGKTQKEIIIQGDHVYDVAEMIVDKFGVPETAVFLDVDGEVVPLR